MAEQVAAKTPCKSSTPVSVEEVIEASIGNLNCSQVIQTILASVPLFFDNQQTFISIFTDGQPAWHYTNHTTCSPSSYICSLSKSDWAWDGNVHRTIISEWGLECASALIKGLPATSFFAGCFLGGFVLASFGDSQLGRKNLVFISCLIMSLAALASAFAPNIWVYCLFRFICGVGRVSITISSLVLLSREGWEALERANGIVGFCWLHIWVISDDRHSLFHSRFFMENLYLSTSISAIVCCTLTHLFLYESPRWLFMQDREKDALAVLKRIGSIDHINTSSLMKPGTTPNNRNPFSSITMLLKKKWAIQRLLVAMILSFGMGLMYSGTFLGVGILGLNIYLITTFNCLLFLASSILSYLFWIPRCNRQTSLLGFCTISGISSIISTLISHDKKAIQAGSALVSLFCASMVFNIIFMYIVEMFPTCVRNCATALSRQALLAASLCVPILVEIGMTNSIVTHVVFGVVILLSGILVISSPETRGKVLCDTMEEQEVRDKGGCLSIIWLLSFCFLSYCFFPVLLILKTEKYY